MMNKSTNKKRILYVLLALVVIVAFVVKLKSNKNIATERVYHYDKEQPIEVQTQTLYVQEIVDETFISGNFDADKESKISAETQGKINSIPVEVGDYVTKGQTLVQQDNALLKLQLQSAELQIEGLTDDVNRYTILANSDAIQGVQLEKATLGLKNAKINRATLQEQINKTTIKAPFSGFVTMKFTEVGAFAAPGMPLVQITDLASLRFTIQVSENELSKFELGKTYTVFADVLPDEILEGKATLIGSKANMGGSYPIQFALKNVDDFKIKSGMFGKVSQKTDASEKGILIPSSAIIGSADQAQVYLVVDGKAQLKTIKIGRKIQNKTVVISGIEEGDVLVINGLINLFEGANVSVTKS